VGEAPSREGAGCVRAAGLRMRRRVAIPPRSAQPAGTLDDAAYRAHARFRYALRRFLKFSEARARAAGITPTQHQMLLAIRGTGRGWLSVGEIARRLMIRPHSAAGLVERASRQDLVVKEPDPADARVVRVALTERGQRLIAEITADHRVELARLWRRVPPLR
jgi:DNA-binding MarR family transcriptional regulator